MAPSKDGLLRAESSFFSDIGKLNKGEQGEDSSGICGTNDRAAAFVDGLFVGQAGEFGGVGSSLLVAPGQTEDYDKHSRIRGFQHRGRPSPQPTPTEP